jgi:hypothetical protein
MSIKLESDTSRSAVYAHFTNNDPLGSIKITKVNNGYALTFISAAHLGQFYPYLAIPEGRESVHIFLSREQTIDLVREVKCFESYEFKGTDTAKKD